MILLLVLIACETTDGKVTTCLESIESIDEQSKTITYKLFSGDIDHNYKNFKFIFQAIDDNDHGGTIIKWTVEYERLREEVDPPYGHIEYLHKCTKDIDGHLLKA